MSHVEVNVENQAGVITLCRPEKRNALTRQTIADLSEALGDLHQERSVRTVILTGRGPAFCAGMDLAEMQATAEMDDPHEQWGDDARLYRDLLVQMLQFPRPIIAAVNGPAVAGGMGLAVAADILVASAGAKFGLPEPRRGIVAGIVAPLLVFRIGAGRAAPLLLTSSMIGAEAAHRIGLVYEVVAEHDLLDRALAIGDQCAAGAPEAIQLTKRMLNETIGNDLTTLLAAGAAASATARTTEAAAEGLKAFLEKRAPLWP